MELERERASERERDRDETKEIEKRRRDKAHLHLLPMASPCHWTSKRPLVLAERFSGFTSSPGIQRGIKERERERERDETKEIEKRGRDKGTSSPSSHGVCPLHVVLFMFYSAFSLDSRPLHVFTFLGISRGRRPTKPLTRCFPWPSESITGSV